MADSPARAESEAPVLPAGLVYVTDERPGIRRLRRGERFVYERPDGRRLDDERQLARIAKLAIPPAYTDVWICTDARGHLQATGRDARGRKQYRYHAAWRSARDETKFGRMLDFGAALPKIRSRVERDLTKPVGQRVPRETVLAAIVRLLDTTLMRVGNDEYARTNGSYGLTTLRRRHVAVHGEALTLRFRGKSGVVHEIDLRDRRVAKIVRRCQSLPGQELFQCLDDQGATHAIGSQEVNDYLREASGGEFTAKDFRTWHGTAHALRLWRDLDPGIAAKPTLAEAKRLLGEVAARLGNTVAVCRKAYVHPRVLALLTGEERHEFSPDVGRRRGLSPGERGLLKFLSTAEPAMSDRLASSVAAVAGSGKPRRRTGSVAAASH